MSLLHLCFWLLIFIWKLRRSLCSHKWHEKDTDYVLFDGNRTGRYGVLVEIHRSGDARYVCRASSSSDNFPHYICGRLEFYSTVVRKYSWYKLAVKFYSLGEMIWSSTHLPAVHPISRIHFNWFIGRLLDRTNSSLSTDTPLKSRDTAFWILIIYYWQPFPSCWVRSLLFMSS